MISETVVMLVGFRNNDATGAHPIGESHTADGLWRHRPGFVAAAGSTCHAEEFPRSREEFPGGPRA
jgi:hypothetical protein